MVQKILLNVKLTRKEIASIAGISEGNTIKVLSDLKKERIIDTKRGKEIVIYDIDKLKNIVKQYYII